jgi:hypothetical protein
MVVLACVVWIAGCGDGGGNGDVDPAEVLAYVGLAEGQTREYDVEYQTAVLEGRVVVAGIDKEYASGVDAYKVEFRQSGFVVATRWYQVTVEGLFLLGEEVQETAEVVERTYLTPVKLLPYPVESKDGIPVQSWTTEAEVEQGGSETHRFDNRGKESIEVPAGTFESYHLAHTRRLEGGDSVAYDEYFSPRNWYPQFEYPNDNIWKLTGFSE